MSASVVKDANLPFLTARDNQLLITNRGNNVITGVRNLFQSADADPILVPDGIELASIMLRIVIPGAWQRRFGFDQQSHPTIIN